MNILRGSCKRLVEDSGPGRQFNQSRRRHPRRCSCVATPVSKKQPSDTSVIGGVDEEEQSTVGNDQYFNFITKELEEIFGLSQ